MLGWLVATAVAALVLVTVDLLRDSEIFDKDSELREGNGRLSPYGQTEETYPDTEVEITAVDEVRGERAVVAIREILGNDPVQALSAMNAKERAKAAQEIHRALCSAFSIDIKLQMGTSYEGICGEYRYKSRVLWVDYRYLMSTNSGDIEEYLDTVFHEFRHAMQMLFSENRQYNGVSEEYSKKMASGLHENVYVSYFENPELYYKQLCERDARKFAERFIARLKGGN